LSAAQFSFRNIILQSPQQDVRHNPGNRDRLQRAVSLSLPG
jgi:hypothetical protein